jgi:hypothetical protein
MYYSFKHTECQRPGFHDSIHSKQYNLKNCKSKDHPASSISKRKTRKLTQDLNSGDVIVKRFVVSQMPAVKLRFDPLHSRLVIIDISRIIITKAGLAISAKNIH